jgi:hypothetical protein
VHENAKCALMWMMGLTWAAAIIATFIICCCGLDGYTKIDRPYGAIAGDEESSSLIQD